MYHMTMVLLSLIVSDYIIGALYASGKPRRYCSGTFEVTLKIMAEYELYTPQQNNKLLNVYRTVFMTSQPWVPRCVGDAQMIQILGLLHVWIALWSHHVFVNTLRPRQNGRHFADDPFKRIFFKETLRISFKISLNFVLKGPINNIPALVQIMAWRRRGDKPLSEPMMISLLTHICVTRPQWVNITFNLRCEIYCSFTSRCRQIGIRFSAQFIAGCGCVVMSLIGA